MRTATPQVMLLLLAALLVLFLLAPFVAALPQIGAADWRGADARAIADATLVSLLAATIATLLNALCGIPLAFLLADAERGGRRRGFWRAIGLAVQLPLALPPLSSGVLLLFLFGFAGPVGRMLNGALSDDFAGVVVAEAFVSAPFLVIAARSAFRDQDPALAEVAATLGHSPLRIFLRLALPMAARPILAGAVLAWLRGFGEFGATMMLAYHPFSLPVLTSIAFDGAGLPAMLPVIAPTLLAAVSAIAVLALLQRRRRHDAAAEGEALVPTLVQNRIDEAGNDAELLAVSIRHRVGTFTLDVSWTTRARRLAILGASGSGKTMCLRAMAGLLPGAVRLGARDLGQRPPQDRGIAYVPQSYGLAPHLPVSAQIGAAVDADPALARYWADRLGLTKLLGRFVAELSPGQRQRVALARALARPEPTLLLLDEPFSALDAPLRARLRLALAQLLHEAGTRSVLVTHDPAEAMQLADTVLLLQDGRVLQAGPVAAVFARPAGEAAARLLGTVAAARGIALAPDRIAIGGGIVLRVAGAPLREGPVGWAVNPERVRVCARTGEYSGTILQRGAVLGGSRALLLRLGDATLAVSADPDAPPVGPCLVSIDPDSFQVWPVDQPDG